MHAYFQGRRQRRKTQCKPMPEQVPAPPNLPPEAPAPRRAARGEAGSNRPPKACTPEDWVQAATEVLVDGGVDLVRVDVIARHMGMTRGSFYWHFKDREDLLQRILQAWRDAATEQVTQRFSNAARNPRDLLHEVLSLPFRGRSALRAGRVELAIRDWARRDTLARQAVDEADNTRISYIAQCFSALGFSIPEARHRAGILYAYQLGESLMAHHGTQAQKSGRSELVERLLMLPEAGA